MILLDPIVEILHLSQFTGFEDVSFHLELVEGFGVRRIFVHVDHSWFTGMGSSKRFVQELLGRVCISCRAQEEIERVPLRINRSVEVDPLLFDFDVRLVHPPGIGGSFEMGPTAPFDFGCVALHPTVDGRMIDVQSAFEHHFFEIAIAE